MLNLLSLQYDHFSLLILVIFSRSNSYNKKLMQTTSQQTLFALPCEEFYSTIASTPNLLSKGYDIVYKYLSLSSFNRESTLLHLLSEKSPVLTLVTRTYPVVYSSQPSVSSEEKSKTKQFLILEILFKRFASNFNKEKYANEKNLNSFLMFLVHFHNSEGFQSWVPYYQKLLEELIKINSDLIGYILIELLKGSDDRVSCFSKYILSFIINNQSNIKVSEQDSLEIIYYCIKSMAYLNGVDDQLITEYFEPYQQKILNYILVSMSKSIKIMKFSLKILTVLTSDYEVELEKQLIDKIVVCSRQLTVDFVNSRLTSAGEEQDDFEFDGEEDEDRITINVILYQLIELFETLLTSDQMKVSDFEVYLSVCLPSLLLSQAQYKYFNSFTESYLSDIESEDRKTLRNKVISFLLELYEGQYSSKAKGKLQAAVLKYSFLIEKSGNANFKQQLCSFYSSIGIVLQLKQQHLILLEQSLSFLLYHLTEEILCSDPKKLQENKQSLLMKLGEKITSQNNIVNLGNFNLLNKLIKSMNKSIKAQYYKFLIQKCLQINNFQTKKGYILAICRGIAYVSSDIQITISQQPSQVGIPLLMLQNLVKYLTDSETMQQSIHLILQFLLMVLKKCPNSKTILQALIQTKVQIHIILFLMNYGMIADVIAELMSQIATNQLIAFVYQNFLKGNQKRQYIATLIAGWVKQSLIELKEKDISVILFLYKNSFVDKVIKEYFGVLKQKNLPNKGLSNELIALLNQKIHPSWILPMLSCNLLQNPQHLLITTIQSITNEITSQFELQNQLLLPYYTFLNDPSYGINLIKGRSPQLYEKFVEKLIRYAQLFQGPNLKVITCLVLLNICEIDQSKTAKVIQLISSYGNNKEEMQDQQWEQQNQKDEQSVFERMFNLKMSNDEIQKQLLQAFGDKVGDMKLVNAKVEKLAQK